METPEAAARRFAGELGRLHDGLEARGVELSGPIDTAAVDAALNLADQAARRSAEPNDADVHALAEVITEAWEAGIRAGHMSLARWILDRGWRRG
jgi:hypothetical protein